MPEKTDLLTAYLGGADISKTFGNLVSNLTFTSQYHFLKWKCKRINVTNEYLGRRQFKWLRQGWEPTKAAYQQIQSSPHHISQGYCRFQRRIHRLGQVNTLEGKTNETRWNNILTPFKLGELKSIQYVKVYKYSYFTFDFGRDNFPRSFLFDSLFFLSKS